MACWKQPNLSSLPSHSIHLLPRKTKQGTAKYNIPIEAETEDQHSVTQRRMEEWKGMEVDAKGQVIKTQHKGAGAYAICEGLWKISPFFFSLKDRPWP
jgi:hypothetical protein